MKTKDELIDLISKKLFQTQYQSLTFSDLSTAVVGLSQNKKDKLMEGILDSRDLEVGQFLNGLMVETAEAAALTQATSLMTDDNLTLAELQLIFI